MCWLARWFRSLVFNLSQNYGAKQLSPRGLVGPEINCGASTFCPRRICCLLDCLPDRLVRD